MVIEVLLVRMWAISIKRRKVGIAPSTRKVVVATTAVVHLIRTWIVRVTFPPLSIVVLVLSAILFILVLHSVFVFVLILLAARRVIPLVHPTLHNESII